MSDKVIKFTDSMPVQGFGDEYIARLQKTGAPYIRKEKEKARRLRDSAWWKRKCRQGSCRYCGKKFRPVELSMDHIIPLSRGGRSTKENLVPCCKDCNNKKKNLLPVEWNDYLDWLGAEKKPEG